MSTVSRKFYITTPIYYVNAPPHIGHAYTTIAADVIARFKRLAGYDVLFATGTDEHGIKIERTARANGVDPKEWCDRIAGEFKQLWERLNISYDDFIRTTEPRHERVAQAIFERAYRNGDIYKGIYEGWYCASCESFYLESELVEGKCPVHGRPVEWTAEECYLFRLSQYQDWLLRHIEEHPEFVEPESRRNEVLSFVRSGLLDLAVSRSTFKWGIPVPFDPDQVIYVWIDALTNYITVAGYGQDEERFQKFWPADVHLVGKEILRFHAVIWPILLHSAGIAPPKKVFAHGWWTFKEQKISKSTGVLVDPWDLAQALARLSGAEVGVAVDAIRYFLLREVPFGQDGDFSDDNLITRFNADLANDYGNLLNRTLPLVERYFQGVVPEPGPAEDRDHLLRETALQVVDAVEGAIDRLELHRALQEIWRLLGAANKYLDEGAPWSLVRRGQERRAATVLYNTLEAFRIATILLSPTCPTATRRAWEQLGIPVPLEEQRLEDARKWQGFPWGTRVRPGKPIFPRIEREAVRAVVEEEQPQKGGERVEEISLDEFKRLDLRVGIVREAKRVPGTEKLLELRVDIGGEVRTLVTGLIPHYTAEDLVGKRIVVLANLQPRQVRGVTSQGMLLAAEWDNEVALLTVEKDPPPGAKVS
ncbi:MAG: methionine--tRNA ligase [Armatimonadota bacterium]|nr:methionine--tRNA ligase [Armatimonadota bacterium]